MNKKTLEDELEDAARIYCEGRDSLLEENYTFLAFIIGAKWIRKRMYSHEEVNNLISDILYKVRFDYSDIDVIESNITHLFENFKKKYDEK